MEAKHWSVRNNEHDVVHDGKIGSGGFGEVHKVSSPKSSFKASSSGPNLTCQMRNTKSETFFARKLIRPFAGIITDIDIENEVRAIRRLCKTDHPNIVQVIDYGNLNDDGIIFFIDMVLCETSLEAFLRGGAEAGGRLWDTIREDDKTSLEVSYTILQHIVNGLHYIHTMGEVHRDLSPHNGMILWCSGSSEYFIVLYKSGYWQLADFGLTSEATSHVLVTTSARGGRGFVSRAGNFSWRQGRFQQQGRYVVIRMHRV
jgi:serine/threonine protein kinase